MDEIRDGLKRGADIMLFLVRDVCKWYLQLRFLGGVDAAKTERGSHTFSILEPQARPCDVVRNQADIPPSRREVLQPK